MSYLPREWSYGAQKIFIVMKQKSRFTFGPNAAKITDYINELFE